MTETQWLTSEDPAAMLEHLKWANGTGYARTKKPSMILSDRKLRLFACACCRQIWHLLTDERSRKAVEVAERYADGLATEEELDAASREAAHAQVSYPDPSPFAAAMWCTSPRSGMAVDGVLRHLIGFSGLAALLRDIVGNPYQPMTLPKGQAVSCPRCEGDGWGCTDDGWGARDKCKVCDGKGTLGLFGPCPWLTHRALALAEAAYEERGRKCERCKGKGRTETGRRHDVFGSRPIGSAKCPACHGAGRIEDGTLDPHRLAVLSDALEDAGCTDEAVLQHLRGFEVCPGCAAGKGQHEGDYECGNGWIPLRGLHYRGCHVLDLLLGKE